jgi:hypothetical protein
MQSIRWPRVLFGGALAGCVVFVLEAIASLVYAEELTRALAAHDLTLGTGPGSLAFFLAFSIGMGWGTVWLYAAIQPRFGAGVRTAVIAGVAIWALWFVPSTLSWVALGLMAPWVIVYSLAVALVESICAAFVGAWVYPEAVPTEPERAIG